MFMRYRGGGIGHASTRTSTDVFLKDRARYDIARVKEDKANTRNFTAPSHDDRMDVDSGSEAEESKREETEVQDTSSDLDLGSDEDVGDEVLLEEALDYGSNMELSDFESDLDDGYEDSSDSDSEDMGHWNWGAEDGEEVCDEFDEFGINI